MDFYVVDVSNPKYHKVEFKQKVFPEAAIAYISLVEMQQIIVQLSQTVDLWFEERKVEPLHDPPADATDEARITVVSSHGTSVDRVRITNMCDEFAGFDHLMPTKRILWQFQTMRWDDGCVVRGYRNEEMPKD